MEFHCWWLLCQGREESGCCQPSFAEFIYCHLVVSSCVPFWGVMAGADDKWKKLSGGNFSGVREPPPSPPSSSLSPSLKAFPAQTPLWLHLP